MLFLSDILAGEEYPVNYENNLKQVKPCELSKKENKKIMVRKKDDNLFMKLSKKTAGYVKVSQGELAVIKSLVMNNTYSRKSNEQVRIQRKEHNKVKTYHRKIGK